LRDGIYFTGEKQSFYRLKIFVNAAEVDMVTVTILDGYVDEPTCLGVPPYMSPYPRYIAGALWCFDKKIRVHYVTIDQIRRDQSFLKILSGSDLVVVVTGMVVPGRYLAGFPASPAELNMFLSGLDQPVKVLCGPAARHGFGLAGGRQVRDYHSVMDVFDLSIPGDSELVVYDLLENRMNVDGVDPKRCRANAAMIRDFAVRGAQVAVQHPNFPDYFIAEIETYRGCPRSITGGCSFCSEPLKGAPDFRSVKDVVDEVTALYSVGCRHFRLGNQPCIFSYMAYDADKNEFPQPNPEALEKLLSGIHATAPDMKTLHIDNANPGVIARYPNESRRIAKTIIKYHTPGDVAAFGVESVDPTVIKENNLKASAEEVKIAVKLLNEVGTQRGDNGLPELLPGLNFVFGLIGETKQTFQQNYEFLKNLLEEGLLFRRINLRQALPLPGTRLYQNGKRPASKNRRLFHQFKRRVRETIDRPMLTKLLPKGTLLRTVYTEVYDGKLTLSRQVGSYPILVGIPGVFPLHQFLDVKIVDYGYRSVTAVPYPLSVNHVPRETLMALPGIGMKRCTRILTQRPFTNMNQFIQALDDPTLESELAAYLTFKQ
jgi:radical SAM superfamily enzyme with C-terminal helix-hairpin-helix motif